MCEWIQEPFPWKKFINQDPEKIGPPDDGKQVKGQGPSSENLADDRHGGCVCSGTGHQEYDGSARGESFQHQYRGNGNRSRSTYIQRNGHHHDDQHFKVFVPQVGGKEALRDQYVDQGGKQESNDKPFCDVFKKFHKGIFQHATQAAVSRFVIIIGLVPGFFLVLPGTVKAIGHQSPENTGEKCNDGFDDGHGQTQQGIGNHDAVQSGLRGGNKERNRRPLRCPAFIKGDARGDHPAGTKRQGDPDQGRIDDRCIVGLAKVFVDFFPGEPYIKYTGKQEAQQKVGSHLKCQCCER